jgi:Fe/S biogenesis protein NfuA
MAQKLESQEKTVEITSDAVQYIIDVKNQEKDGDSLALYLEIVGATGREFKYDLYFDKLGEAKPDDLIEEYGNLSLVIPAGSVAQLTGAVLDLSKEDGELILTNPNKPELPGIPENAVLDSELAQRVAKVLYEEVNPAIASHGGRADLIGVDDNTVYLELSGGCQGCGMAKATLTQGIEVAIKEAVPEIQNVVDVTDHSLGANPYF